MKQVRCQLTGMQSLADGRTVLTVKKNADYQQEAIVLNPGQIQRLCMRALGFPSAIALKNAIAVSNGAAIITFQQEVCKAGEAWENPVTGEKGIYGTNNEGKDWIRSSNHEIELGLSASMKLFEIAATAGIQNAIVEQPVARTARKAEPTPEPKNGLGIEGDPQP